MSLNTGSQHQDIKRPELVGHFRFKEKNITAVCMNWSLTPCWKPVTEIIIILEKKKRLTFLWMAFWKCYVPFPN